MVWLPKESLKFWLTATQRPPLSNPSAPMGSCWSGSASASAGAGEREPLVKKTASARLFAETLFGRLEADENGDVRVRDVMRELRRDRAAAATALGLPVEVARGGNKGGADGGRQALLMRVGDALKLGGDGILAVDRLVPEPRDEGHGPARLGHAYNTLMGHRRH